MKRLARRSKRASKLAVGLRALNAQKRKKCVRSGASSAAQRSKASSRIPRLTPADVPREFYSMFGEISPEKAERVAEFVDLDQRRSGLRIDVLLLDIGSKEIGYSSISRGFDYLRAGRYLLNHKENDRTWRRK